LLYRVDIHTKDVGQVIQWSYDPDALGRVKDVFAPDGGHWQYLYHYLGDVASVSESETLPGPRTTTFQRDNVGRMTKRVLGTDEQTDPDWTYAYDGIGRFVQIDDPTENPADPADGTELVRDESGRVKEVKRDGDVVDSSLRDTHGRISWVKRVDGTEEYKYDLGYNAAGDISSVKGTWQEGDPQLEGAAQHDFLYDSGGRLSSLDMSLKQGGQWETDVLQLDYGYDNSGRLASISLGGGTHTISLQRDAMGRLATVDYSADTGAGLEPKARTVYTYNDLNSWLTDIEVGQPDPNGGLVDTAVLDLAYSHDLAGRIVRIEEGTEFAREFGYDDVSRLTSATDYDAAQGGNPLRTFGYSYNKVGERTEKSLTVPDPPPGSTESDAYAWNSYGVLTAVTGGEADRDFSFDLAGNLQSITPAGGQPLSFVYDDSGRIKQTTAPDGTVTKYWYGPNERRTRKSIDTDGDGTPESVTRYFSDGLVTYEIDEASGDPQRAYVFMPDGFTPVMLVVFGWDEVEQKHIVDAAYFLHNDHLSTPRALTNVGGTVVWRARYAPFGSPGDNSIPNLGAGDIGIATDPDGDTVHLDHPLRFPGQWDDGVPGVWYNWHRFYLPEYGMYGRRDPLLLRPSKPGTYGLQFGYGMSMPTGFVDPTGLEVLVCQRPTEPRGMAKLLNALLGGSGHVDTYHAYAWDTRYDNGWGLQGSGSAWTNSMTARTEEKGPAVDMCWPVEGSEGHEEEIMNSVYESTYWREKWPWIPGLHDCHDAVEDGIESAGFEYPEGPFRVFPPSTGDEQSDQDWYNLTNPYYF